MSDGIEPHAPGTRTVLVIAGLAMIGMMAFPFMCPENGGCRLAVVTPWSGFSWAGKAGIAIFVTGGLTLILQGIGLRTLGQLLGIALIPLFAVLINAIFFGLHQPACAPVIGMMRLLADVAPFPACRWWPTLAAAWVDAFFIGLTLEILRKEFLPQALRARLKRWTQGLMLLSLAPLLVLMVVLLLPAIGRDVVSSLWKRWRRD